MRQLSWRRRVSETTQLASMVDAAGAAAAAGRWQEAEQLWSRVHAADPGHVQALFSLGVHAFQRGDAQAALGYLQRARARAPRDSMILLPVGRGQREGGGAVVVGGW